MTSMPGLIEGRDYIFVLLEGVTADNFGQRFFSTYRDPHDDPRKSADGQIWYRIIGYTDTAKQAQVALRGKPFAFLAADGKVTGSAPQ
jgi:hypothetical protein